jgi:hypothetical protein
MIRNKLTLIISVLMILSSITLNGTERVIPPGEEKNEEEVMQEAQKDLAAILQWSVKYRFSPDLKVGDKVEYQEVGDPENKTVISLEVTKKEKDGVWIIEKFDDNEIHMLIDLKNMELVDFFGYDEDEEKHEPPLLDDESMEERVAILKDVAIGLGKLGYPIGWEIKNTKDRIETKFGSMECGCLQPKFNEEIAANEQMNIYFSNEIPKMIPFEFTISALTAPEVLLQIDGGLLKNSFVELKTYNKY